MPKNERIYVTIEADGKSKVTKQHCRDLEKTLTQQWRDKGWKKVSVNAEPR